MPSTSTAVNPLGIKIEFDEASHSYTSNVNNNKKNMDGDFSSTSSNDEFLNYNDAKHNQNNTIFKNN